MVPASSMVLLDGPAGSMVVGSTTVPVPAVRVVDSGGNGVAGETVTFTVAAGGGRLAPAVIANLDAVYRTGGSTVVTNEAKAVLFTTGQGAVSVSRVAVMFNGPTSTYPASFQARVALHAVSGGNPAAVLAQSEVVSLTLANSRVWHVFTLPALTLAASQSYALVVSNPGVTGFRWANTDSSFAPSAFGGATYDGARFWNLTTSQWDSTSAVNAFVLGADVTDATTITVTTSVTGVAALGGFRLGTAPAVNTVTATHALGTQSVAVTGVTGPAAQLVFTTAPSAGSSEAPLVGQPAVQISDALGNPVTTDSSTVVTLSLAAGSGGQLGGTLTATAASGVATFSGVTLTGLVGTAYMLRASASGLTSADAAGVSLTGPGPATQATASVGQMQTATIGTAVAARPAVVVRDMTGNGVPGVAVTFAVGSGGGSVTGATTTTDATGVATVGSWTVGLALGSNTLAATVSGLSGSPVTFAATAVAVAPAVPTSVQVGARNGALVVRWQAPAEAPGATPTGQVLQYRALPDGDWSGGAAFDAALRDATVNGLTNGTAYEVRLASENSGGRSAWSTPVQGRPYRIDLRVAEMRALTATSYLLSLQWTYDGASPGDFVLEGGTADGQRSGILVGPVTLWRGIADAGRYSARVRLATDVQGDNPSNEVQVTAQTTVAPATPTNLRANVEGDRVTLAWVQDLSAGVPLENYLVVEGLADPIPVGLGTAVTFRAVAHGVYHVRIAAVNEAGASALSAPVLVSVPGGCVAPQTPTWLSVGLDNGEGLATWETASNGGAATDYLVTVEGVGLYATGGASRLAGRLATGEYRISVQAQNACGVSAPSAAQVLRVP